MDGRAQVAPSGSRIRSWPTRRSRGSEREASLSESLAALATLVFIGVAATVGARLVWLARRTRSLPELALGAGLLVIVGVGYPLALAGRGALGEAPENARWLMACGSLAMACGWSGVWIFTWRVFRAGSRAARWLTLSCIAATFAAVAASGQEVLAVRDPGVLDFGKLRHTALALLAMGMNAWAAAESLRYHARMRRRLALGLADPIVTNRFLLFALVMGFSFLSLGVPTAASMAGIDSIKSPPVLIASAVTGVACSASLWLAFVPPRAYVRRLRAAA